LKERQAGLRAELDTLAARLAGVPDAETVRLFVERIGDALDTRQGRVYGGDESLDNLELLPGTGHRQRHGRRMGTKSAASREGRS
jgi:hypothetical protein